MRMYIAAKLALLFQHLSIKYIMPLWKACRWCIYNLADINRVPNLIFKTVYLPK
jgi:hypothetical protein